MQKTLSFSDTISAADFAAFAARVNNKDIFQDPAWSIVSAAKGWQQAKFFAVHDTQGEILVAALGYINQSQYFGNYLYIQHGPLIPANSAWNAATWGETSLTSSQVEVLEFFCEQLRAYAQQENIFALVLEPLATAESDLGKFLYKKGYVQQPRSILPRYPLFMDLSKTEAELLAEVGKSTRYNIRQAEKQGVEIEFIYAASQSDTAVIETFYKLLLEASTTKEFSAPPLAFFQTAWEQYKDKQQILFALAKYQGEVISANFTQTYGNWAGSYYTANSRKQPQTKASYLLKWQTILEAKRQGKTVFDMWGHLPNVQEGHSEYGYGQFKKGFHPIEKTFCGRVVYPVSKFKYSAWKLLGELRYKFG